MDRIGPGRLQRLSTGRSASVGRALTLIALAAGAGCAARTTAIASGARTEPRPHEADAGLPPRDAETARVDPPDARAAAPDEAPWALAYQRLCDDQSEDARRHGVATEGGVLSVCGRVLDARSGEVRATSSDAGFDLMAANGTRLVIGERTLSACTGSAANTCRFHAAGSVEIYRAMALTPAPTRLFIVEARPGPHAASVPVFVERSWPALRALRAVPLPGRWPASDRLAVAQLADGRAAFVSSPRECDSVQCDERALYALGPDGALERLLPHVSGARTVAVCDGGQRALVASPAGVQLVAIASEHVEATLPIDAATLAPAPAPRHAAVELAVDARCSHAAVVARDGLHVFRIEPEPVQVVHDPRLVNNGGMVFDRDGTSLYVVDERSVTCLRAGATPADPSARARYEPTAPPRWQRATIEPGVARWAATPAELADAEPVPRATIAAFRLPAGDDHDSVRVSVHDPTEFPRDGSLEAWALAVVLPFRELVYSISEDDGWGDVEHQVWSTPEGRALQVHCFEQQCGLPGNHWLRIQERDGALYVVTLDLTSGSRQGAAALRRFVTEPFGAPARRR